MAITATLAFAGHNFLRYLIDSSAGAGETVEIPSTGGATPDLRTDALAGPLKQIANVFGSGYGSIPSTGVASQAQARALLLSDGAAAIVGEQPAAIARATGRNVTGFSIDADQGTGTPGAPSLKISAATAGIGYVDIECPGAIGA
jgi:hypothetical protein